MMPMVLMMIAEENDSEFIQALYLKNENVMYAMAIKIVKEHHTACDIVSSASLTMLQKIDYLLCIRPSKLTPYILSIVKNTALMYLRKRRSENYYLVDDDRVFDWATCTHTDVDDALIAEAETQMLIKALNDIADRERELLVMKYFEQLSDEEIAKQMGIGKNSVRSYLTTARRKLRETLIKEDQDA